MFNVTNQYSYAIVGASADEHKYGYKILFDLVDAQFKVFAINPHTPRIEHMQTYPTLSSVKEKIDVVVFVVTPIVTEKVLLEVKELGIKKVWMQPGSSSEEAVLFCEKNNIDCMYNVCVMINKQI